MNRKLIKISLIIFIIFCVTMHNKAFAAGNFTINKSSISITEGSNSTFVINGSSATGRVDISSSNTTVATVDSNSQWLENNSKTIIVTGKKAGTATITVSGTVSDENGYENDVKKTIQVTVKEKSTTTNNTNTSKSNNANLKTLGVTPKEYDFSGFSKSKTSYNVTVPSTVDSLTVKATAEDAKAKVKVSGNSGFDVGSNNKIKVVVTAEDGKTTKTYTIKVTKLATDEEQPGNVIEDTNNIYLTSLELEGLVISPEFSKDIYTYTATLDSTDVNDIKVNAVANNEKAKIEISGNTGLVAGENIINIVVTLEGSTEKIVYQVTVNKTSQGTTAINGEENKQNGGILETLMRDWKKYVIIAAGIFILMLVAVFILIYLLKKENKKLNKQSLEENDDEYDVYKDNKNEITDKDTMEEINKQTDEIFRDKVKGQTVEFDNSNNNKDDEEPKGKKGRHF